VLLHSYFIPSLFCQVGVAPFVSSLSVGFIMVLASIMLVLTIEKVILAFFEVMVTSDSVVSAQPKEIMPRSRQNILNKMAGPMIAIIYYYLCE